MRPLCKLSPTRESLTERDGTSVSPVYARRRFMVLLSDVAEKQLLTVAEAAQYLGVQERTIYSWASQETIPSVHIGRRLLFHQEELDRMIEACKREAR